MDGTNKINSNSLFALFTVSQSPISLITIHCPLALGICYLLGKQDEKERFTNYCVLSNFPLQSLCLSYQYGSSYFRHKDKFLPKIFCCVSFVIYLPSCPLPTDQFDEIANAFPKFLCQFLCNANSEIFRTLCASVTR